MAESTLDNDAVTAVARLAREGAKVQQLTIGDRQFTDRNIVRVPLDPDLPKPLSFYTLDAFAKYLKADPAAGAMLVHVVSPSRVEAVGVLEGTDKHLRRQVAIAECQVGNPQGFKFNDAVSLESLSIALQTCFAPQVGAIENLRKFCASIKSTEEIGIADDGVSQEVNAKAGIAAVVPVTVNNPWLLAPFRTFAEIDQPTSPFVLRFFKSAEGGAPRAALFETGNAHWKTDAVMKIATYLRISLGDFWQVLG